MLKLPQSIKGFMDRFKKAGFKIFVVGGAVRDLLLKRPIDNWDFTTDAKPEEILKLFPQAIYNNKYGTVTIAKKIKPTNKNPATKILLEITPFRKESQYTDFRHPKKIEWAKTIREDLSRRDFTVNAIAFDGKTIIDPFQGQKHLKQKLIVAVGNPDKRFSEDGLRLIRAIRLASQLGFLIKEETQQAIKKNAALIKNISWERIRDEILKILASDHPGEGILFLKNTGLLNYIIPELEICFSIPQKSPDRHHIYDVGTHSVLSLKHCPSKDKITRLAALLHDIGKAKTFKKNPNTGLITFYNHEVVGARMVKKIAQRLKLSNKQKEKLIRLVRYHQFTVSEKQTDKAIRRFIKQVGKEYLPDILALRTGDRIGSGAKPTSWRFELFKKRLIEVQKKPFTVQDLKINGYDVMNILKIKPGPTVGKILNTIFEEVVAGRIKNKKPELIKRIRELKPKSL